MESSLDTHRARSRYHRPEDDYNSYDSSLKLSWSWVIVFGFFLIQLSVPSLVSTYGVLLAHIAGHKQPLWSGSLTPMFFIASWCFADPVCRKLVSGYNPGAKYMAIIGVLVVSVGVAANSLLQSVSFNIVSYGIVGGVGTSLVVQQAEAVLFVHFPTQRGLVMTVGQVGMALGQFCMPLLLSGLISSYGAHGAILVQAGVVLHGVIGAALLLPPEDGSSEPPYQGRPRSYAFLDDVEMTDSFSWSNNSHSGSSPLLSSGRSWKNPANKTDSDYQVPMSSPVILGRRKNAFGVDILPEIPEECEDSDDSDSSISNEEQSLGSRKGSVINWNKIVLALKEDETNSSEDNISEDNPDHERNDDKSGLQKWPCVSLSTEEKDDESKTKDKNSEIITSRSENEPNRVKNKIIRITISEDGEMESENTLPVVERIHNQLFSASLYAHSTGNGKICYNTSPFRKLRKRLNCFSCCNWYCRYKFYKAVLSVPNKIYLALIVPLIVAVKVPKFVPALCISSVARLCPIVFAALMPSLTIRNVVNNSFQEAAFTVSVSGFTWLCFLVMSPCFTGLKPRGHKCIYCAACLLSSIGLYFLSSTHSHNLVILGCAFFGLGHGATMAMGPVVIEEDLGVKDAVMIQGPMDALSGFLVLFMAVILSILLQHSDGISHCFIALTVLQATSGLVWVVLLLKPLLEKCQVSISNQWPPSGDFMTPG